jgi:hypothetical protein
MHILALARALALVTIMPLGVSASIDETAVCRRLLSTRSDGHEQRGLTN